MKAVHFGAGNIGRGFVGLLLHDAGYEVVFADVAAELIDALAASPSYDVIEVGMTPRTRTVDNYRALNSRTAEDDVVAEIATAEVVTTAVGAGVLRFVAPVIARAIEARSEGAAPLAVMACENAINATGILESEVRSHLHGKSDAWIAARAVFANTAVDRIVPVQSHGHPLDVEVEDFFEWVIESRPFRGAPPEIPGVSFVDDLTPYIERKLFTVNTGHAAIAYHGFAAGASTIAEAVAIDEVADAARRVLEETSGMLVAKHGIDAAAQRAYRGRIIARFINPALPDTVERVGRSPIRKLGRAERFVGPAAEIAESGGEPVALLAAIGAALRFDLPADPESVELQRMVHDDRPEDIVTRVCGVDRAHPLFDSVVETVRSAG